MAEWDGGGGALEDLQRDCRKRVAHPPPWDQVADYSFRLKLGSAYVDAAVATGLLTDASIMASVDSWPSDVREAMERLGLFERYSPTTWHGLFTHLSDPQINGLVSNVKGVDFEMQVVDKALHGHLGPLPHGGDHIELAHQLNQAGWDAELTAHGDVVGHLQMKATDHWQLIADHLSRYPQYPDVVTTHEAAQSVAQHGFAEGHIIDSGISGAELTNHVHGALAPALDTGHLVHEWVPEVSIAAILAAAAIRIRDGEDPGKTARWVKKQMKIAGLASSAALVAQVVTHTVWVRPIAAIGTRFMAARREMSKLVAKNATHLRASLQRITQSCRARGYKPWYGSG